MKVIVTGATDTVGEGVMEVCLQNANIETVVRNKQKTLWCYTFQIKRNNLCRFL